MRSFQAGGRTWEVAITVGTIARIRGTAGVDFFRILDDEGRPVITTTLTDEWKLLDVLYAAVKPQADAQNVDKDAFFEAMSGDALRDAQQAFAEELADFSRRRGHPHRAEEIEQTMRTIAEAYREVTEAVRQASEQTRSGPPSTGSPGSSGSTPTDGRSGDSSTPTRAGSRTSGADTPS